MTPADIRKLEHSHKFFLKHMQCLPRRTPTNFTLSAIHAVPMETVIDHKKLNFLGQLFNLSCSNRYMAKRVFNIRLTCWPSRLYTMYLIDIYQMECFPLSVHENKSFMKRLSNEVTLNFFHECVGNYPTFALLILRSDGVSCIWTLTRHCQELSSICRRTMRIIGRVVMPKCKTTCSLCNRVNSDLVSS